MPVELMLTLAAIFTSVAVASGSIAALVLSRTAPEIKRLRAAGFGAAAAVTPSLGIGAFTAKPLKPLRKAATAGSRLQRRLAGAGWEQANAVSVYTTARLTLAAVCGMLPLLAVGVSTGWMIALPAAAIGYMVPDLMVGRRLANHKRAIQNALPDALDLLVVCMEAGSSLDQAILKASEELEIALPAMAHEFASVSAEIRAGKPRMDAFQDFARRTKLDDVRALVAMLIQTDRFGTSIAQALRTHADTLRTKRRQRAEERAGKVGVKLVFPLVLCLMPALYAICLGPVVVRMYRSLF